MSRRPRALDLFCGPGGTSAGLAAAGFEVVGVDARPQRHYPFEFVLGDVFEVAPGLLASGRFDAVVAGPTCNDHSYLRHTYGREHGSAWQVAATRELLAASGLPYAIENVEGYAGLVGPTLLCASMFGLPAVECADGVRRRLRRHRLIEASVPLPDPGPCRHDLPSIGVHGGGPKARAPRAVEGRGGYQGTAAERRAAMGIDWMTRDELSLAIPPAYFEWIGRRLAAAAAGIGAGR